MKTMIKMTVDWDKNEKNEDVQEEKEEGNNKLRGGKREW